MLVSFTVSQSRRFVGFFYGCRGISGLGIQFSKGGYPQGTLKTYREHEDNGGSCPVASECGTPAGACSPSSDICSALKSLSAFRVKCVEPGLLMRFARFGALC